MKNLEQIRARNAMAAAAKNIAGVNGGEVIKKIPPLIMNHGLLAIGAYAYDEKNTGFKGVMDAIANHLSDREIALIPEQDSLQKKKYSELEQKIKNLEKGGPGTEDLRQLKSQWMKLSPMGYLLEYLVTNADSTLLKRCTAETMAWLEYARRFIKKA